MEIFRNWVVNLREPDIWTEGGLLVLSCKRICPIITWCNYKNHSIIDRSALIFSVFSLVLDPVLLLRKNKRAKCARIHANQNSPSFTLFLFNFHVSLHFSTERATTRCNAWVWHKVENVDLYLSIKVWMKVQWDGTLATAAAECYGDRIQLLKAVKPGE